MPEYRDPDSGLTFPSYEQYEQERRGRQWPTEDEICASEGHQYEGDDGEWGRCYCGAQQYPKGGPVASGCEVKGEA